MELFISHWFSVSWSNIQIHLSIAYKELFPIAIAASIWEHLMGIPTGKISVRRATGDSETAYDGLTPVTHTNGGQKFLYIHCSPVSISAFLTTGSSCRFGSNSSSSSPTQRSVQGLTEKRGYYDLGFGWAQRRFLDLCIHDNRVKPNDSILPRNKETLMCFCSH